MVTIRATRLVSPDEATRSSSPGRMVPAAMVPQNPRKSRLGRFTHWTGSRNGCSLRSSSTGTVSRKLSSVGPEYHGVFSLFSMMLSPLRAEIGRAVMLVKPSGAANCW